MALFGKAKRQSAPGRRVQALLFDTFGTTVDWYSSMLAHAERLGAEAGVEADWPGLIAAWRARYKPAIMPVREGKRPWTGFDELHREELDRIVRSFGAAKLTAAQRDRLTQGWHTLKPWPEVPGALHRLAKHFILGPLSNGTTRQLVDMARYGNLPWDVIFGADMFHTYKPAPQFYREAVALLGLQPAEVMLVAAHSEDLQAAQKQGLRTCFVHRPTEDTEVQGTFDHVLDNFEDLARTLDAV